MTLKLGGGASPTVRGLKFRKKEVPQESLWELALEMVREWPWATIGLVGAALIAANLARGIIRGESVALSVAKHIVLMLPAVE